MTSLPPWRTPNEKIVRTDILATSFNMDKFCQDDLKRVVVLACGHYAITKNIRTAHCPRCQHMWDSGEDWDAFRRLGKQDTMAWPNDPCRSLNEPTGLDGSFLRDDAAP